MATARLDTAGIVEDGKNLKQVAGILLLFEGLQRKGMGGESVRKERVKEEEKDGKVEGNKG